jgi:hypothetical protein
MMTSSMTSCGILDNSCTSIWHPMLRIISHLQMEPNYLELAMDMDNFYQAIDDDRVDIIQTMLGYRNTNQEELVDLFNRSVDLGSWNVLEYLIPLLEQRYSLGQENKFRLAARMDGWMHRFLSTSCKMDFGLSTRCYFVFGSTSTIGYS